VKSYFNSLNEREKWMVFGAALCVLIYVYYMFLYSPLISSVTQKSDQLIEKTANLEWMNKVKQQKNNSSVKQSVNNGQLLTLLATQLKDNSDIKFPYQLQQTNSGEIQLSFEQVPFNLFIEWLLQLNNKYTINIKQMDVNKTPTHGITKLMIILSAAGNN
jgi:general secretion pathway protein M